MFFGRGQNLRPQNGSVSITMCINLPPEVNSGGLVMQFEDGVKEYKWLDYTTPRIMLLLATMFTISQVFHSVLKRFGIPIFISQIFAGILLSRPALQVIKMENKIITPEHVQLIGSMGNIGIALFIFQSGVKMDLSMVSKVGRKALYIGILSVISPLVALIPTFMVPTGTGPSGFFITPLYYVTSFPVIFCLLTHLKILNSELGRLAQSSAIVADFLSYATVLLLTVSQVASSSPAQALRTLGYVVFFIFIVMVVVRPAMLLIVRMTPEGKEVSQTGLYVVILILLLFLSFARKFYSELTVAGLYIVGLAVPRGPPLGSALVNKFDCLVSGFFLPIFVTTSAMRIHDLRPQSFNIFIVQNILTVAWIVLVKFGTCSLLLLYWKMHKNDAMALALIMNAKGIVEMAFYTFASDGRYVPPNMFRFMLGIIIVMGSIVPIFVRKLYDPSRKYAGYQIKKLVDCKPESELQIVCCIYIPSNISSAINLLSISCPRNECPTVVNALHLIKLSDQATSIFVSHQKKKKNFSAYSYSENVIVSFKKFGGLRWGAVSINTFTAISPLDLMHDDICTLALDKLASLVILSFHRTWYIDGSLESDDQSVRNLNLRILEKAPCSVGILIDHGNLKRPVTHMDSSADSFSKVALLFLGGNDDREALTLAKRMGRDDKVRLTVVHFIAASDDGDVDWETILDSEVLRDIKKSECMRYEKHVVENGGDTVEIVHSMVNQYDLIIVGRRHNLECPQTSCLDQWSEFPELGVLGDLLASKDFGNKCSVLVLQQQRLV
ncbi:hypothetical protein CUMW_171440 [Citrus unshiu]|uniref:Uncharacterized protein n=1 Tax=Citrus unshiu TaxID=55188 RepID=A0A2H5PVH6_CITUN|nr:hypothetical protein CUMW_171440 [Citrus unshiu]